MRKDLRTMIEEARALGVALPVTARALECFDRAVPRWPRRGRLHEDAGVLGGAGRADQGLIGVVTSLPRLPQGDGAVSAAELRKLGARELRLELEALYADYAGCLDDERFEDWPAFFADDCVYRIVPRANFGLPLATWSCAGKGGLADRVVAIRKTMMYAPRYVRRLVTGIRIQGWDGEMLDGACELSRARNAGRRADAGVQLRRVPRPAGRRRRPPAIQGEALRVRQPARSRQPDLSVMSKWVEVAKVAEVPEDGTFRTFLGDEPVCLYNVGGTIYATHDTCTHGQASLADGFIDDDKIECPLHQGLFQIATGKAVGAPCTVDIRVYPVKVENGAVLLEEPA